MRTDSIAALSAQGAIALIRLSGSDAISIAAKLNSRISSTESNRAFLAELVFNGELLDRAVVTVFRAPNSYTGEDTVELCCHGGSVVKDNVLAALIGLGARLAEAGEFSKRAFLNGKMDLSRAEGVADLINAESSAEARAALGLAGGALCQEADRLYSVVLDILAAAEASLDYPEEGLDALDLATAVPRLRECVDSINQLLDTYSTGRAIKDGVRVVLAGAPNAGKSSLFNALTGADAIVTSIAGTTTDTKTETAIIDGIKFLITDTAGLRSSDGVIERLGVERAQRAISAADIVVEVVDIDQSPCPDLSPTLTVFSKLDLHDSNSHLHDSNSHRNGDKLYVSALTGEGLAALRERLVQLSGSGAARGLVVTSVRHYEALKNAKEALSRAADCQSSDLLAADLHLALHSLGLISGKTASEDLVNTIFSKFCLGK